MRAALFTCLFVVCFGNKAHQCGDKIGSCGAPRASLMQVGSSNKRRMSLVSQSASRSGSRVSRALAGFEKYTNNLVSKYGTDNEAIPLSNDVKAAIETVKVYINGLFDSLNASHYNDIDRIQRTCGQSAVDDCENDYFNTGEPVPPITKLANMHTALEQARKAHVQCRIEERQKSCQQNDNCAEYDKYRESNATALPVNTPAKCAFPTDDFGTPTGLGKLADDFINTGKEPRRDTMEKCLENFRAWFTPLYTLYQACDRDGSGEKEDCAQEQRLFEEKHCDYNFKLNETCHSYDVCIKDTKEDCSGLCDEVDILVSARKAENETGERILCLLTVLTDTSDENKKTELDICTKKTYNTSYFDLICPGDVGYPVSDPPISCTVEPVSCSYDFLAKYYASSEINAITGAHNIPYTAVCDCSHKCPSQVGEHVAPSWDIETGKCGWLPGWEDCAMETGGDFGDPPVFCPGDDQATPCPEPA